MPEPLGKEVVMRCFVDDDHSGENLTHRSSSVFIIFLQMASIYYCSKRQNTVETSTFGSEFMAMKLAWKYICGLRYKLMVMGIPFSDTCFVYGDNKSVLYNTTLPESTLKNKSNSIAYHDVREGVATGEWLTGYEPTDANLSYLLKNPVPGGERRTRLFRGVMYYIWLYWFWVSLLGSFPHIWKYFLTIVQLGSTAKVVSKLSSDAIRLRELIWCHVKYKLLVVRVM